MSRRWFEPMVIDPGASRPLLPVAGASWAFAVGVGGAVGVTALREFARMVAWERVGFTALGAGMLALALSWSSRDRTSVAVYWLLQTLAATLLTLLSRGHGALALLPVLAQTVFFLPARGVILFAGYVMAVTVLAARLRVVSWSAALGLSAGHLSGALFVVGFTAIFIRERQARRQSEELATARERTRIAREVHDILGHSLTAVQAQLAGALAVRETEPLRAAQLMKSALTLTEGGLNDVRRSVSALRGESGRSLIDELRELLAGAKELGLDVELTLVGEPYQPPITTSLAIFRMVQECITNGIRHGAASSLRVTLRYGAAELSANVEDDGVGAERIVPGAGLNGIRERVTLLGGELHIESRRGAGVRLTARIPSAHGAVTTTA